MAYKDKKQLYNYNNAFQREKYDTLRVLAPKGEGQTIKDAAALAVQSVSAYILQAVRDRIKADRYAKE